jgi:hypothetical protein
MTSGPYRNLICDPVTPVTVLDRTAAGIISILSTRSGAAVPVPDIDTAISAAGGKVRRKVMATKALRNIGYTIITHKARHLSWYKLAGTPTEYEIQRQHVVREAYSRQVSVCRELAGAVAANPSDPSLTASYTHGQMTALSLGTDPAVGMTIPEVIADLVPL